MPRAALPLLCALLVAALGVTASSLWLTRHQPELTLLAGGPGEWIVYPLAPQARARDRVDLEASFRCAFRLAELPARAALEARALGRATVRLNGAVVLRSQDFDANWKRASFADVTAHLRPGENTLEVRVLNDAGPPALNLAIVAEERLVATDAGWEASLAGAAWHPARPASQPTGARARPFDPAHASPATALRASPAPLAACALLSALAVAAGAAFQRRLGGRPWPPRLESALVAGAVALWLLLFLGNAGQLPLAVGFDVEAHLAYLDFLLDQHRLPLASDGWQMYQPPLFYLLAAGLLGAVGLATTDPGAAWVLRGLTFATGVAQVLLLYAGARLLWPARRGPRLLVLLFAAFLPLHLYLFQYVGNEGLAAALASAASLLLLRLLRAPRPPARGYAALGACLGAALLTKFSTLVLVPAALVALAFAAAREGPGAWRPRLRGALLALGVALLVCGWHFLRVWLHFGDPFVGNWDPHLGYDWWQDPGYRTPADFLRFGHVFVSPWFASFHGLWDGLYSTLWGDGLLGGLPLASQSLWSQGPMAVGYGLALVPSLCIAVGVVLGLAHLLGRPRPAAVYLATLAVLMGIAFVALYLRVAAYGQAKAFYAQPALLALCVAFALGADWIARRGRAAAFVLLWLLGLWAANAYLSVWVTRNPASLYARSQLLFATGAIAEAEAALDEALRRAPANAQLHLARFELLHETGRHAEAALRRALEADPDATGALLAKAGTQIVRREYTEAEAKLRRVLARAPADERVHRMLASALIGQRRLDEAEAALREQLRIDPTDRLTQLTLVRVLSLGDRKAAARQLRHWLRIAPDDAEARQLHEELEPRAPRREAAPPRSAARPARDGPRSSGLAPDELRSSGSAPDELRSPGSAPDELRSSSVAQATG